MLCLCAGATQAQVTGSGTTGKVPKWTAPTVIGDSAMTEDAAGNLGIGIAPSATLKVLMQSALTGSGATLRAVNTSSGRALEGTSQSGIGVNASSVSENALTANSTSGYGIWANSSTNIGLYANSNGNHGVYGVSNSTNTAFAGIRGLGTTGGAYAGRFTGNVSVMRQVSCQVGGLDAEVLYAGPAPGFAGLDQINVCLPQDLVGRRAAEITLSVEARTTNALHISVL